MTLHHALALDYVTLLTLCDFTKIKWQKWYSMQINFVYETI